MQAVRSDPVTGPSTSTPTLLCSANVGWNPSASTTNAAPLSRSSAADGASIADAQQPSWASLSACEQARRPTPTPRHLPPPTPRPHTRGRPRPAPAPTPHITPSNRGPIRRRPDPRGTPRQPHDSPRICPHRPYGQLPWLPAVRVRSWTNSARRLGAGRTRRPIA